MNKTPLILTMTGGLLALSLLPASTLASPPSPQWYVPPCDVTETACAKVSLFFGAAGTPCSCPVLAYGSHWGNLGGSGSVAMSVKDGSSAPLPIWGTTCYYTLTQSCGSEVDYLRGNGNNDPHGVCADATATSISSIGTTWQASTGMQCY